MIQAQTMLNIADNSGAKSHVHQSAWRHQRKYASVGDVIVVAIKSATPVAKLKGSVERAVIVRTAKEIGRSDGSYIRSADNAAVIIDSSIPRTRRPGGLRTGARPT